jgi:hypothetical protein
MASPSSFKSATNALRPVPSATTLIASQFIV